MIADTAVEAVGPGALRALATDTLALWGVDGTAEWQGGELQVSVASGQSVAVRPATETERPARWFTRAIAPPGLPARPPRPSLSVVGLLGALRGALGVPQARRTLRIAAGGREGPAMVEEPGDSGQDPPPVPGDATGRDTPVLVVTGFLGSGKTTLVARMLRDPAFARTAVIVNEWGAVGIDHDLLAAGSDAPLRLATGCLCCAVRGDLATTLLDLDRRRRSGEAPFDRVVIETSGLADPAPILHELMTDAAVASHFRPDGVVTLVDTVHGEATLVAHVEARQQVSLADRVLLTKTDLAGPSAALQATIAGLNPDAPVRAAAHGLLQPGWLFGARPITAAPPVVSARMAARHTDGVRCVVLSPAAPVPAAALALLLRALAEQADGRLLRAKGLVHVLEQPGRPALVQGVQHVFEAPEWLETWPDGERETRLVLIASAMPQRWPSRLYAAIAAEVRDETARRA